jgi:hypothetical protein
MIRSAGGDFATGTVWNKSAYRYAVDTRMNLAYDRMFNALVIINYTSSTGVSATHKQKIKEYMRLNDVSNSYVVLLLGSDIPGSPWTDAVEAVEWDTISAIKLSDTVRSGGGKSYAGGYDIWDTDGLKIRHDLKPTDTVVYYSDADYKDRSGYARVNHRSYEALTSLMPGVRLVQASRNRWEKLRRLFPGAIPLRTALSECLDKSMAALSWDDIARLNTSSYHTGVNFPRTNIDDPEVVRWLEAVQSPPSKEQKEYEALRKVLSNVGIGLPDHPKFESPMDKYPLAHSNNTDHSIIYINAVYAAREESE